MNGNQFVYTRQNLFLEFSSRTHALSVNGNMICKLHMCRMIENDTDLLKFYTRKAVIGAGTGCLHLVVIGLVFSLYALAV